MVPIRITKTDGDTIITRINAENEKEIAEYYFSDSEIDQIEILYGLDWETDLFIRTPIIIYRPSQDELEHFQLSYKVRCTYTVYNKMTENVDEISCGILK